MTEEQRKRLERARKAEMNRLASSGGAQDDIIEAVNSKKPEKKKRAKRRAAKTAGRRRRRIRLGRRTFITVLALFAAAVLVTLSLTVFFKISRVSISGNSHYSTAQIEQAAAIELQTNLFLADTSGARSRIAAMPYVNEVKVRRKLPSTVDIQIKEATAAFQTEYGGQWFLCDMNTKVLEKTGLVRRDGLLAVYGIAQMSDDGVNIGRPLADGGGHVCACIAELLDSFERNGLTADIKSVRFDGEFFLSFDYKGNIEVDMGTSDEISEKIDYFAQIVKELDSEQKGTMDLSDPSIVPFRPSN